MFLVKTSIDDFCKNTAVTRWSVWYCKKYCKEFLFSTHAGIWPKKLFWIHKKSFYFRFTFILLSLLWFYFRFTFFYFRCVFFLFVIIIVLALHSSLRLKRMNKRQKGMKRNQKEMKRNQKDVIVRGNSNKYKKYKSQWVINISPWSR